MVQLVRGGIGWGFIYASKDALPKDIVVLAPEFVQVQMQLQYDVIWAKNQPLTEVHQFLLDQIKRLFSK